MSDRHVAFDIEADIHPDVVAQGDTTGPVHCVVAIELGADEGEDRCYTWGPEEIPAAIDFLSAPGIVLIGHNVEEYDIPVLAARGLKLPERVVDTKLGSRFCFPGQVLKKRDFAFRQTQPAFPGNLVGWHSLEAWGWRLRFPKQEYTGGYDRFTPEMLAYCQQDVRLTARLFRWLMRNGGAPIEAHFNEAAVGRILRRQRLYGVGFNTAAAVELMGTLTAAREELTVSLRSTFTPWWTPKGKIRTPKRTQESKKYKPGQAGYVNVREGCAYQPIQLTEFNPGSDKHVADRLQKVYKWRPTTFTDGGDPSAKEEVIADLPFPPAKELVRYKQASKILGFISEGSTAWLKLEKGGRLHGRINPTGAVTGRMSHFDPNTGQVPSPKKPYGKECRALFVAPAGKVLVGCDAKGLQLRILAHYLAKYDGGAFAKACVEDDPHTYMQKGTGIVMRETQKTWTYARLFGAGFPKLGFIIIEGLRQAHAQGMEVEIPKLRAAGKIGRASYEKLVDYMTGLDQVDRQLKAAFRRGYLVTLDGHRLPVLAEHTALATLLQGGESVVMKRALVIADAALQRRGFTPGVEYEFVLNVHDEWQAETTPDLAEAVGMDLAQAINTAGEELGLRVRLDGDWKVGTNWSETH